MLLKFSNLPSLFFDKDIAYTTNRYVYQFKTVADFSNYFVCSLRTVIVSAGTGYLSFPGTIIKEFSSSFIFEVHKEENKYILNEIEFKY